MKKNLFKKIIFWSVIAVFGLSLANTALGVTQEKVEVVSSFFNVKGDICQLWKAIFEFSLQIAGGLSVLVISIGGIYYISGKAFFVQINAESCSFNRALTR